ncbi:adenylyltransferase/cytidyltransferase family protein [Butyrivibrio sp. M55]|uniref:adenylyltransferase/cytidyltransferase family protein n=1 Tax=Butyrivibrio sp. M55 TaxID=1855323 RepID=UPI0008ED5025|nr:adenylyltransferase/cytidyltransferase family protein [Butyrivibrio sp. M55]SFU59082.1 cytidyltransferase-like domain-containing protein [Butyrivibrio sp. M55]
MINIGIVFGCFIPMHKGHESLIKRALDENDKIILAVCGYQTDRGRDFIDFETRIRLVEKMYKNEKDRVIVIKIDDKKLGLDGTFTHENWVLWGDELFANAGISPDSAHFTWYTGEPSYVDKLGEIYPHHTFTLVDRQVIKTSGTEIRNNPDVHESEINSVFLEYLRSAGKLK